MEEYINKAKLMRKLKKLSTEAYQFKFKSEMEKTINACIDVVDSMPTIDIVSCKDCKYCKIEDWDGDNFRVCTRDQHIRSGSWFCADGEVE